MSTLLFIGELALAFGGMLFAGLLFNVLLFPEMWQQDDVPEFINQRERASRRRWP